MNICKIKTNPNPSFKGCLGNSNYLIANSNNHELSITETHFMRDLGTLDFCANYLKNNFPQGTHVANPGCSYGYETYSLGTLLSDVNQKNIYKITGYDIAIDVIEEAKLALFKIGGTESPSEKFLTQSYWKKLTPVEENAKRLFEKSLEEIPPKWLGFNVCNPRYKTKAKKVIPNNFDYDLSVKRLEAINTVTNKSLWRMGGKFFIPKQGGFDDVIDFKTADIKNLKEVLPKQETGLIIFKNALYHLFVNLKENNHEQINHDIAEDLFSKVSAMLPVKGIFALGTRQYDHLYFVSQSEINTLPASKKNAKMITSSPVHKILRKLGFEPVFFDLTCSSNLNLSLPSVWRKARQL